MWSLYLTAKTTCSRPSDLVCITDRWAALCFDNAVTLIGNSIENAAQEMHNVGTEKAPKWEPKYTVGQLLDPAFRLPAPLTAKQKERESVQALRNMARSNHSGIKVFKAKE